MKKYGKETVLFYMGEIMNYSERRILAAIQNLPRGSFSFEDYLEGDGISRDRIAIRVTVTVKESSIVTDFSASDPQVLGPLNCRPPSVNACVYYVAKALLDPGLPPNMGAFRQLEVITRPGTLLEVEHPGAVCNANIITTQRIVDVLLGAFLKITPERVCAACSGTMNLLNIGGRDPRSGSLFNYIETYGGGQGALVDRDGTSAVQNHMTNTRNAPVEVIESTYPLLVRGYGLVPETAGPGKFRGGYGMKRIIEILGDRVTLTLSSDRFELAPWGIFGGGSALPGSCIMVRPDGSERTIGIQGYLSRRKGITFEHRNPGRRGSDPYERSPRASGKTSWTNCCRPNRTRRYGVVFNQDLTVNEAARRHSASRPSQHPSASESASTRNDPAPAEFFESSGEAGSIGNNSFSQAE